MPRKESILVFSAHSDDFVLGAGGTIANYTKEGKKVTAIVFSYGEKSHPWLKEEVVQRMRAQETLEACTILKCSVLFFDLRELQFEEDFRTKNLGANLVDIITKEKPSKIFTHSLEDPHPDHKAVHTITLNLLKKIKKKPELYIYSIWNPVSFRTTYPALFVKISKTFSFKMQALKTFRSQKIHILYPVFLLLFRNFLAGIKLHTLFAEKFYRIK
ncbi:PIG-L family deacetylase [Candidatus Woesearchaeota archaeon]|nr:PIG-L family deacetylase [Candidatus Woesearchaeota archaeon]